MTRGSSATDRKPHQDAVIDQPAPADQEHARGLVKFRSNRFNRLDRNLWKDRIDRHLRQRVRTNIVTSTGNYRNLDNLSKNTAAGVRIYRECGTPLAGGE